MRYPQIADRSVDLGHKWLQRNGRLGSRLRGVGFRDKLGAEGVFCVLRMSFMVFFFEIEAAGYMQGLTPNMEPPTLRALERLLSSYPGLMQCSVSV